MIYSGGCTVHQSLLCAHKILIHHFICLLNWIKISLESMFLSFIIIGWGEESYQTWLSRQAPRQLAEIMKYLQSQKTSHPHQLPSGIHVGLLMTKFREEKVMGWKSMSEVGEIPRQGVKP